MNDHHDTPQQPSSPYAGVGPQSQGAVGGSYGEQPYPASGARVLTPQEERTWAAAAHGVPAIAWLFSAGLLGFVASLVIYLMHRDKSPFLRQHAVNSLNAQLTSLVYMLVSGVLAIIGVVLLVFVVGIVPLLLGLLGIAAACLLMLWIHVNGAIKAWDGKAYEPPFTIRFVR